MANVEELLADAATKLHDERSRLEREIAEKESEIERHVAEKQREIEPLRTELRAVRAAIARVEGKPNSGAGNGQRAPRGQNRAAILEALKAKPMTAAEVAEITSINRATVTSTLAKLTSDRLVAKAKTPRGVEHSLSTH